MPPGELDALLGAYAADPYERENLITIAGLTARAIRYASSRDEYLELGIGHGAALEALAGAFREVLVVEGSGELVRRYTGRFPNVRLVEALFETWESDRRWTSIGMGFVLEHVDDPGLVLRRFRPRLAPGGSLFVGVPNARSLHRLLGQRLGLLPDLNALSPADLAFGHKRFWTYHQWVELFESCGYRVARAEGLYLKPVTTKQLDQLALPAAAHAALDEFAAEAPTISNSCFFQLAAS